MTIDATLSQRYAGVCRRVADAAARAGRRPHDVILVAVSKGADVSQIRELMALGHVDFGENRVHQLVQRAAMIDEYLARRRVLVSTPRAPGPLDSAGDAPGRPRWHMIGHVQRNKARKAVDVARLIHSVDSLRLAEEIHQHALRKDKPVEVLLEVNCSGESAKHGCPFPAARHLADQIDTMMNVRLRGLMTMAAIADDPEQTRPTFARARELFEEIRASGVGEGRFNILSMGMTADFEVAISEGANLVRIGTAIFGPGSAGTDDEDARLPRDESTDDPGEADDETDSPEGNSIGLKADG